LYPILLKWWAKNRAFHDECFGQTDSLPKVSVLLAAYNEAAIIEEKLRSIFSGGYPLDRLEVLVGDDASKDDTAAIIRRLQQEYPQLHLVGMAGRTGKPQIINQLVPLAKGEILLLTDANIIFSHDTIYTLVKHFKDPKVGFTAANILSRSVQDQGISVQEDAYVAREIRMKHAQSKIWGIVIAPFGACYALRTELYEQVPKRFNVDDFFISMKILGKGYEGHQSLEAVCYEDISNKVSEEFRRKTRISKGNFQNLMAFWQLLWPPYKGLGFSFLSHKVIRWLGPFIILMSFVSAVLLALHSPFYQAIFGLQLLSLLIAWLDPLLERKGVHIRLFRFISYFYSMNLALLMGFWEFLKGVDSNIWEPTERSATQSKG